MIGRGRRRKRSFWFLVAYLLVVVAGAVALWVFVPDEVKNAIRETYLNAP